ncbi:plastid-lipid-associated protein [Vigna angularis]|uniref:Plastid-lipid-associated protein n=1 Tax=Phaseolus angularis TaxID=3914 RepID=A0A8T0KJ61_PHAAN|nr:plastid-lipid-associated protein [Vigna angularis]
MGSMLFLPSCATATRRVPLYLPYRNVPSTCTNDLQYGNPSTQGCSVPHRGLDGSNNCCNWCGWVRFDHLTIGSVGVGYRVVEAGFGAIMFVSECHLSANANNKPLSVSSITLKSLGDPGKRKRVFGSLENQIHLVRGWDMIHMYMLQNTKGISAGVVGEVYEITNVTHCTCSASLRSSFQLSILLHTLIKQLSEDAPSTFSACLEEELDHVIRFFNHNICFEEAVMIVIHLSCIMASVRKVGILGNAADFYKDGSKDSSLDNLDRREMMIAFDMRCVGFIMAKMVMRELMDPSVFAKFKSFLIKGYDPSCLRELMLEILGRSSPYGNTGLQILDRNWGAGWHLLSLLLATKPSQRISCLDALRHPFLCGPRWRVVSSMDIIRWGLGSTAVRITEEYIYRKPQRSRLAHFIDLMEMLNPHPKPKNWLDLLPGKWRLLYCTGKHVGLTLREPPLRVLVGDVHLTVTRESKLKANLSFNSDIGFSVMIGQDWPLDKAGKSGRLRVNSSFTIRAGRRLYLNQDKTTEKFFFGPSSNVDALAQKFKGKKWSKIIPFKEFPSSLPAAKLASGDIDVTMNIDDPLNQNTDTARSVLQELRTQIPPEVFDLSKLVCGTYVDSRMLVLRGVNGSALLFTRSFMDRNSCS